ncbi:MAG: hypothetical protein GY909_09775 [Oligoflexia bacterium]|nr:hypothetical protein [Oligoflexia bacterium]
MSRLSTLVLFFLVITAQFTHANVTRDIFLAKISTDIMPKTYDLLVTVDEKKEVVAIKTRNNKKNKIKVYKTNVLDKPITLVKTLGITLISLKCSNFNKSTGCNIEIEYPYNVTYGKFRKFNCKLIKDDGEWKLSHGKKSFSHLHLKANKVVGLLVGIKKLIPKDED